MDFEAAHPWYHGSPRKLNTIRAGSTITQKRELARIFSHKPTIVSISDDGRIKHNGSQLGYLYVIADEIKPDDVIPHPRTTMSPGDEWLTERALRAHFLELVAIVPDEILTAAEVEALQERLNEQRNRDPGKLPG